MKQLILGTLANMQKYFGKKLEKDVLEIYLEGLKNLSEDDFKKAAVNIMHEFSPTSTKPFPLIADFLEACGVDDKTQAVNIITKLRRMMVRLGQYRSPIIEDEALKSVIERYGGWVEMVNNNYDEWWSLHERNFILAYESAKRTSMDGEKPKGILEIDNTANGYTPEKLLEMGINPKNCGLTQEQIENNNKLPSVLEGLIK